MEKRMRIIMAAALALALLLCAAAADFETLTLGARSESVKEMKQRLGALGYYSTDTFTREFTQNTVEKVRLFQRSNGLPETGAVDAATWEAIFSDAALPPVKPTMKPVATPAPLPRPELPAQDAEGYLAGEGEWFYENDADGLWMYLSPDLQITIVRRQDSRLSMEWFETEILARNGQALESVMTDPKHLDRNAVKPETLAKRKKLVLAFSDDFSYNRVTKRETLGVIIRDGQALSKRTNARTGTHLPNLDMMAQYPDGSLRVYDCNEISADELLELGAVNVFSFGPWLIRDGQINGVLYENFRSIEPRHALGMIAPGHYFVLSVEGRCQASEGTVLQRMAEIMRSHGVTEALNLDGGNTMALVFHGKMLNQLAVYDGKKFIRTMTTMIGIGHTEAW